MDKREIILRQLEEYKPSDKSEEVSRSKIIRFVKENPNCFENDCLPGHITGSALVLDRNFDFVLLNHHAKLNKWLGFGGHSDGLPNPVNTAIREAQEETGLKSLEPVAGHTGILDTDIHLIPGRGGMPEHYHYDIRIILTADISEDLKISHESNELKWVKIEEAGNYVSEVAFMRLIGKAANLK